MQDYYYENFQRLLIFYGYGDTEGKRLAGERISLLETLVEIYQYLGGKADSKGDAEERKGAEKDATAYYQHLLELFGKLTGARNSM